MSCERPLNKSFSVAGPSSVSNRYALSILTHGSCCRSRASSSLLRVSSFSACKRASRAASHSSRVPVLCVVIGLSPFGMGYGGKLANGRAGRGVTSVARFETVLRPVRSIMGACMLPRIGRADRERGHDGAGPLDHGGEINGGKHRPVDHGTGPLAGLLS